MKIFEILVPNDVDENIDQYTHQCHQIAKTLVAECTPFLEQIGHRLYQNALYRGIRPLGIPDIKKCPCPVNRLPSDTPLVLHDLADEWFFNKFGIRYRSNAVFATSVQSTARGYGQVYSVYPVGQFEFCYSPKYNDLTSYLSDAFEAYDVNDVPESWLTRPLEKLLNNGDYKSDSIVAAVKSESEVMIHADYYIVKMTTPTLLHDIQEQMKTL